MSLAACCAAALLRCCRLCERLATPQGLALCAESSMPACRAACALLGSRLQSSIRAALQQCIEHRSEMGVGCFSNILSNLARLCFYGWLVSAVHCPLYNDDSHLQLAITIQQSAVTSLRVSCQGKAFVQQDC